MVNWNVNYDNNESLWIEFFEKNNSLPWRNIYFDDVWFTLFIENNIKTK